MADENLQTDSTQPTAVDELDQSASDIKAALDQNNSAAATSQVFRYVGAFVKSRGGIAAIGTESGDEFVAAKEIVASLNEIKPGFGDQEATNVQSILNGIITGQVGVCDDPSKRNVQTVADPVMMFNGQFFHQCDDIQINGAGITFRLRRVYKNQVVYTGPLGANWDHSYNLRIRDNGAQLIMTTGDLRQFTYTRHPLFGQAGFSYFVPPDGEHGVLLSLGSSYIRRTPDGIRHIFEQNPASPNVHRLSRIEDRHGNFLAFTYQDDQLQLVQVNHPKRTIQFHYDTQNRVTSIADFAGRIWQYAYDDFGDLVAFTTPSTERYKSGLTTCYEYTSSSTTGLLQHNLIRIIDPQGRLYLENEYGTEAGTTRFNHVVRQRQGGGEALFEYDRVDPAFEHDYTDSQRPAFQTNFVDRNGQPIHYVYNKFGNMLLREEYILSDGHWRLLQWHYRYNADGALVAALSPEGVLSQSLFARDFFQRTHALSDDEVSTDASLTQNDRMAFGNLLAAVRRGRYQTITAQQLAQGLWGDIFPDILGALDASDTVTKFTHDSAYAQPLTVSDPRFTARADPNHAETPSYQAALTRYAYAGPPGDATRLLASVTRPTPTWPDGTQYGPVVEQFIDYDAHGRLREYIDAAGVKTQISYFPAGDPLIRDGYLQRRVLDPTGLAITTEFEVDSLGRVRAIHHPRAFGAAVGQFITRQDYNALDQVIQVISPTPFNFVIKRFYDASNMLEREERDAKDEHGIDIADAPEVRTWRYDEQLNLVRETRGGTDLSKHLLTRHAYNGADKRVLTRLPAGNAICFRYDERLLSISRTLGAGTAEAATTRNKYDGDGRLIRRVDARGNVTSFQFDAFGRTIARTDPLGNVTRRDYDQANNLLVERTFERMDDGSIALTARTEHEYDILQQRIISGYNLFPNPLPAVNLNTDHLASPGPGRQLRSQFFFDAKSRRVAMADAMGRKQTSTYDAADRVTVLVDPMGNQTENQYDPNGNFVRSDLRELVRDPVSGVVLREQVFSRAMTFDQLDRLILSTDSLGNATGFSYDSRSNQTVRVDPLGNVIRSTFDIYGRRTLQRQEMTATGLGAGPAVPAIVTGFTYDPNGNVTALTDPLGRLTFQRFDALDRRRSLEFADGSRASFSYDPDGNVLSAQDPNGLLRHYTIDPLGRTVRMDVDRSGIVPGVLVEGTDFQAQEWDAMGRLRHDENSYAARVLRRNSLGWVTRESITYNIPAPAALTADVVREYNDTGILTRLLYPDGLELKYHRNDLDQNTQIEEVALGANYPGSPLAFVPRDIARFEYEGRHRSRAHFTNGAEVAWQYDGARRLIQVDHNAGGQTFLSMQQLFDGGGNLRFRNDLTPASVSGEAYRYDSASRLTVAAPDQTLPIFAAASFAPSSIVPQGPLPNRQTAIDTLLGSLAQATGQFTFTYDSAGNRVLERSLANPPISYVTNNLDQYTSVANSNLLYDVNGNLISDGDRNFTYDAFNRLTRVVDSSTGINLFQCFHDAAGRRVFENAGATSSHLVYSGPNLIAEYRAGAPFAEYTFDDGVDEPLHLAAEMNDQWYHSDSLGSVRALTDASRVVTSYKYSAFGAQVAGPSIPYNPMRYAGRRMDLALGSYDLRTRQYDPVLGRFNQRDFAGMADGTNLYAYAGNNPLGYRDPSGTMRESVSAGQSVQPASSIPLENALGLSIADLPGESLPAISGQQFSRLPDVELTTHSEAPVTPAKPSEKIYVPISENLMMEYVPPKYSFSPEFERLAAKAAERGELQPGVISPDGTITPGIVYGNRVIPWHGGAGYSIELGIALGPGFGTKLTLTRDGFIFTGYAGYGLGTNLTFAYVPSPQIPLGQVTTFVEGAATLSFGPTLWPMGARGTARYSFTQDIYTGEVVGSGTLAGRGNFGPLRSEFNLVEGQPINFGAELLDKDFVNRVFNLKKSEAPDYAPAHQLGGGKFQFMGRFGVTFGSLW